MYSTALVMGLCRRAELEWIGVIRTSRVRALTMDTGRVTVTGGTPVPLPLCHRSGNSDLGSSVVDEAAGGEQGEGGQHDGDQELDPGEGAGVAHAAVFEGVAVDVHRVDDGGVVGAAFGHDEGDGEDLE